MSTTAKAPRENRTITVDFQDESTYFQLIDNGKAFIECILAFLLSLGFQLLAHRLSGAAGVRVHDEPDALEVGDLDHSRGRCGRYRWFLNGQSRPRFPR